jgi:hypothetical protein
MASTAGSPPHASTARLRGLAIASALRRHWLATALLAAGLVLRVLVQFAYRPALFYIDTERYLYDAGGMDPVGYKGPLRAILFVANFDAVAAMQHVLGLAMAVVIYLLLVRRGVPRWLAALAIAPVLLDAYQLQDEQLIMPGTWFEALILAGLAILLWRPGTSWRRTVAAGLVLGTSATVAQVGEALLLPAAIYLLAAGGGWRQAIGRAAALCAAFAVPILAYSTGSELMTGQFFLSHSGVTSFYGRMAAAADCATIKLPPDERAMCPTATDQAQGPDWLEYSLASPVNRYYYKKLPRAEVDSLVSDFSHRVLNQQPLRVAGAYGRDLLKLFALTRVGSQGDTPISRWQFQRTFPYFPNHSSTGEVRAEVDQFGGGAPQVWRPVAAFLRSYQLDGGYTPGPLFALCAIAGLGGSAVALRRGAGQRNTRRRSTAQPDAVLPDPGHMDLALRGTSDDKARQVALACLLCFASATFLLLASDLFEFSWRYQLPALVTLVPAGALGITVAGTARSSRRRSRRRERASEPETRGAALTEERGLRRGQAVP